MQILSFASGRSQATDCGVLSAGRQRALRSDCEAAATTAQSGSLPAHVSRQPLGYAHSIPARSSTANINHTHTQV